MEQGNVHSVLFEKSDMYNYNTPEDLQFYTTNYGDPNTYTAQVNTGYFGQPTTQAYMHHNEFHTSGNFWSAFGTGGFADEPPLLEVLNPLKTIDKHLMDDTDLAGPLIYCLIFGVSLLLTGKAHFGYIYGVALLGWLSIYLILNLMSDLGIDVYRTASQQGMDLNNLELEFVENNEKKLRKQLLMISVINSFEDLVDSSGSGNAIANNANNINEVSPLNNSSSSNSNMERN
ncbi:4781_t:CDS:2 [Entrophospora sp. SA101]|nr:4781_t:CDS:2 [Entrophospora sp. SA101]